MNWRQRERAFYCGSALAIVPALAILPAFVYLIFRPVIPHALLLALIVFPVLAAAEFFGVFLLIRACVTRPFSLLNMLSFGALLVLLVIATYTGVFLAALAQRM